MAKIKLKSGASIDHGQMSIPRNSPLHPRAGAPKNFEIANREHGVHLSDCEIGVIGAHKGHQPDPKAGHGVPVHGGMHFRERGQFTAGISKTQANHPLDDDSKLVTSPGVPVGPPGGVTSYHKYPPIEALNGHLPEKTKG